MKYRNLRILVSALAFAVLAVQVEAATAQPLSSAAIASRLSFVEKLIFESSAARKVEESGKAEALALKAQAEKHFAAAQGMNESGDAAAAEAELNEAVHSMQAAVQAAGDGGQATQKKSADFARRRESVEALTVAHERIATEKGLADQHRALQARVAKELEAADQLLLAGKADEARAALDSTYETVKVSVESLREGETLVRELRFETPQDEYLYELDRNDTHRMLIQVLLAEKMEDERARATAGVFISKAEDLRGEAEAAAGRERYDEAIELLEQSTKELIRAIRSAGVYIPG
ncbi:MAG: hypothetical protein OEW35_06690 [Gammaproteobacteria bacterium]|nr:hypothetical protein [Gammaproteobacteria bacterium]MDH4253195.1 hypothetical protein [Gammaproteobacteria bacterium]MDH5308443.1 hypothetical protein [Gammaproteobacteria bacterium]